MEQGFVGLRTNNTIYVRERKIHLLSIEREVIEHSDPCWSVQASVTEGRLQMKL